MVNKKLSAKNGKFRGPAGAGRFHPNGFATPVSERRFLPLSRGRGSRSQGGTPDLPLPALSATGQDLSKEEVTGRVSLGQCNTEKA